MQQTRAFFSSMSDEEIDAHPLLVPEQKIALKQLSAFKRQLADAQTIDTVSCLLYTSPSPRDGLLSRMPSSA